MNFISNIDKAVEQVTMQLTEKKAEIEKLETDLNDTNLNPYGVTNIDFSKRSELIEDVLKMEGVLMGLSLAKETYSEHESA